jgi:hypothetical protein
MNNCDFAITANGKGLCEVRATATEISRGNRTLAKTHSIFKIAKKLKNGKVFCGYFLEYF